MAPFQGVRQPAERYADNELTADAGDDRDASSTALNADGRKLIIPTPLSISRTQAKEDVADKIHIGKQWTVGFDGKLEDEAAFLAG